MVSELYRVEACCPIALMYLVDAWFKSMYGYDPAFAAAIVAVRHSARVSENLPSLNRVRESGVIRSGIPPAALIWPARPIRFFSNDAGVIPEPLF